MPAGRLGGVAVGELLERDEQRRTGASGCRRRSARAEATPSPAGARRAAWLRRRSAARARRCARRRSPRRAGRAACRSGRRRPRGVRRAVSGGGRRPRSRSARRPGRPGPRSTVRNAVAVRPPRPITLPRSSGWTRTSRIEPRRSCLSRTDDVVGVVDDPADQVLERVGQHQLSASSRRRRPRRPRPSRRSSAAPSGVSPRGPAPARPGSPRQRASARSLGGASAGASSSARPRRRPSPRPSWRGLLGGGLLGHGLARGLAVRVLERLVEDLELVALGLGDLEGALGARQALERLPVAGDLEDLRHGVGRLRADAQPVLRPVGDDARCSDGSSLGWYLPISSITLPSRFLRESTTTMRYCGTRTLPRRFKRILTATAVVSPWTLCVGETPCTRWGPGRAARWVPRARMRGSGRAGLARARFCQTTPVTRNPASLPVRLGAALRRPRVPRSITHVRPGEHGEVVERVRVVHDEVGRVTLVEQRVPAEPRAGPPRRGAEGVLGRHPEVAMALTSPAMLPCGALPRRRSRRRSAPPPRGRS